MSEHRFVFEYRQSYLEKTRVTGINGFPVVTVHVRVEGPHAIYVEGRFCPGANTAARRIFDAACRPFGNPDRNKIKLLSAERLVRFDMISFSAAIHARPKGVA